MPPGMLHAVFTLDAAVCDGGHFYMWETMEHTLHSLIRSLLLAHQVVNTDQYADRCRQVLLRMMGYIHDRMIVKNMTHKGLVRFSHCQRRLTGTGIEDPNLPRLDTDADWIALSAFFCVIKLLNVLSPQTYQPGAQNLKVLQPSSMALQKFDANALSAQERRDMVWGRGLLQQTITVLSHRHSFDVKTLLLEPMLGHYVFHINRAFRGLYLPNKSPATSAIFHHQEVRDIFHHQVQWVIDSQPGAGKWWSSLKTVRPAPTMVMAYCGWTLPAQAKRVKGGMVNRCKSPTSYIFQRYTNHSEFQYQRRSISSRGCIVGTFFSSTHWPMSSCYLQAS